MATKTKSKSTSKPAPKRKRAKKPNKVTEGERGQIGHFAEVVYGPHRGEVGVLIEYAGDETAVLRQHHNPGNRFVVRIDRTRLVDRPL